MPAVAFENVDIIFGGDQKRALALIDEGASRDRIIAETRAVPGAMKIDLTVVGPELPMASHSVASDVRVQAEAFSGNER